MFENHRVLTVGRFGTKVVERAGTSGAFAGRRRRNGGVSASADADAAAASAAADASAGRRRRRRRRAGRHHGPARRGGRKGRLLRERRRHAHHVRHLRESSVDPSIHFSKKKRPPLRPFPTFTSAAFDVARRIDQPARH